MQYEVSRLLPAPDLSRFESLLCDADPAALVDIASGTSTLRLSTSLDSLSVRTLLQQCGVDLRQAVVHTVPSTCCGGCSG